MVLNIAMEMDVFMYGLSLGSLCLSAVGCRSSPHWLVVIIIMCACSGADNDFCLVSCQKQGVFLRNTVVSLIFVLGRAKNKVFF